MKEGIRSRMWASGHSQKMLVQAGDLAQQWQDEGKISEEDHKSLSVILVGLFESSTCSLEQTCQAGGLLHQQCQKVVMEDLWVPMKKGDQWLEMPLSN